MRVRLNSIIFAAVTATALLSNPSWAIDADAVAKALGTSFAQGREDAVSFAEAFERGGQVVIRDLAIGLPEAAGTAKFTETVLDAPGENGDGSIQAVSVTMTDGKVEGDVRCTRLTIGVTGCLTGQVFADYALIRGKVEGRIRAHNVTLARTARVVGDIIHESLMIEPGAFMEGRCERLDAVTQEPDKHLNLVVAEVPDRTG